MNHRGTETQLFRAILYASVSLCLCGFSFGQTKPEFRVCADPNNLPFSNNQLAGFENKIATLIANDLGETVRYVWWGQRRGFIRNTINASLKDARCDVMISVPAGYDLLQPTKPYYRSTYVFVYRNNRGLHIQTLDDPILKKLKIGVHLLGDDYENPPPVHELSKRGMVDNVIGFDTFYSAKNPPNTIIDAVSSGKIDVAIVWGPAAGYFAKKNGQLEVVPVPSGKTDLPFAFDISLGVRKGDDALKARLEQVLDRKQIEIRKILTDYSVPMVDRKVNAK
jgi:mxaJ protein